MAKAHHGIGRGGEENKTQQRIMSKRDRGGEVF